MPIDRVDPNAGRGGLFGWVSAAVDWVRDFVRPSEYQVYQHSPDTPSTAVSDLTADIRLLAVIAVGVMMLSALALLLALIAIVRHQRNYPQWPVQQPEPRIHSGVQVYPSTGPVIQVGYATDWHPADQQVDPTRPQAAGGSP